MDKDKTGSIKYEELQQALNNLGFSLHDRE